MSKKLKSKIKSKLKSKPKPKSGDVLYARLKVVGVGGGGGKAVARMIERRVRGVDFVAINTDLQDLHSARTGIKIHIGKNLTRGLGAGMNPDVGRQAAEENREEIAGAVKGADMVFLTCGLGGGTGTGASPVVAEVAKQEGALVIAVVTRPFSFEGTQRSRIADEGWQRLKDKVDAIITIPNDRLLGAIGKETSLVGAFLICDDVLKQAVQGIADLVITPGLVNVDFADVRAVMSEGGSALMGVGAAGGENRAAEAARSAVNSPLLDVSIDGARGVLFNVSGGEDLTMHEVNEAARVITESIDKDAKVIFGAVHDERLKKGELKITVIATGFGFPPSPKLPLAREITQSVSVKKHNGGAERIAPAEETEWDNVPAFLRRKNR